MSMMNCRAAPHVPNVIFTTIETRDWSVADQKAHESFVSLEINSKSRSRVQAQNIIQEIETALDGAALTLAGHTLVNLRCIFISAARAKSKRLFHRHHALSRGHRTTITETQHDSPTRP